MIFCTSILTYYSNYKLINPNNKISFNSKKKNLLYNKKFIYLIFIIRNLIKPNAISLINPSYTVSKRVFKKNQILKSPNRHKKFQICFGYMFFILKLKFILKMNFLIQNNTYRVFNLILKLFFFDLSTFFCKNITVNINSIYKIIEL